MKFWQRALKSVTRRKGRSFILFLVIFILGNVIAGAVAIQQSTKNVEIETKKSMGARAIVDFDYQKMEEEQEKNPEKFEEGYDWFMPPSLSELEAIGNLSYVKYYDLSVPSYIGTNKIKAYDLDEAATMYGGSYKYSFTVKGVNRKEVIDIQDGLIQLVEGESFTEKQVADGEQVVLISKEVAEANNLSVGDQLVFDVTGDHYPEVTEETESSEIEEVETRSFDFPVKVIGIFSVIKKEQQETTEGGFSESDWLALEQINTVYAPNNLATELNRQQNEKIWGATDEDMLAAESNYQASYTLKSVDDVEAFREEANPLISNEYYKIVASTDAYDQVASGMNKLGKISNYVVWVAALAAVMIISLVVLLFLRDRKHELGIYLSLGENRSQIIGQIIIELLLTSIFALILSLITGNLLGGVVSQSLLNMDWVSNPGDMNSYYTYMFNSNLSFQDVQNAYKVTFSSGYIISYLLLGIGSVLLSAILPLLYILRLNPKQIMM